MEQDEMKSPEHERSPLIQRVENTGEAKTAVEHREDKAGGQHREDKAAVEHREEKAGAQHKEDKPGVEHLEEKMGGGHQEPQGGTVDIEELQKQALGVVFIPPLLIHVGLVLFLLWIYSQLKANLFSGFLLGFVYLCFVESSYRKKTESRIRSQERRSGDRKLLLSDAETARWLNNVVECLWPIFLRKFASEEFLLRVAPWFLEKFKPWMSKTVMLKNLDLGSRAPVFSFFRIGRHTTDGDQLVLEMKISFSAARDMIGSMAVQMRKRVGLGIWTVIHISEIQVEGKIKVGVKFTAGWPVIQRLRICFSEPPVIRMVAKPVTTYAVDVTDLPGIAAWLDKMVVDALEHTLVEPNLLVVDVEKLVNDLVFVTTRGKGRRPDRSPPADWFHVEQNGLVANLLVEILHAEDLKACDPNGKSDPYVKIALGKAEFTTSVQEKTLDPIWHEHFRIPITDWASPLKLHMYDKDRFRDDPMGEKQININDINDGQRHELCVILDNVKNGRLHIALTVEGTHSLEEKEKNIVDRFPDVGKGEAWTIREAGSLRKTGSSSGSSREAHDFADSNESPLKDEYQHVDIGVGPAGCVSVVNPGRHVVRERDSECLQNRRTSRKQTSKREQVASVPVDSSSLAAEHPHPETHRMGLWHRHQTQEAKQDTHREHSSGDLSQEALELQLVGDRGSQLHVKLEVPEDPAVQDELPQETEACVLQGHGDEPEPHQRHRFWRSSGKKTGKGHEG